MMFRVGICSCADGAAHISVPYPLINDPPARNIPALPEPGARNTRNYSRPWGQEGMVSIVPGAGQKLER